MRIKLKSLTQYELTEQMSSVYHLFEDPDVAGRAKVALLLADGKSLKLNAEYFVLVADPARLWGNAYYDEGWHFPSTDGGKGRQTRKAFAQEPKHCARRSGHLYRSSPQFTAHVSAKYGLDQSHSECFRHLSRSRIRFHKPKELPRRASTVTQGTFINIVQRLRDKFRADEAIYSTDAVHMGYQTTQEYNLSHAASDLIVQTRAWRERADVLGADRNGRSNLTTTKVFTENRLSVVPLLGKIKRSNPAERMIWRCAANHKGQDARNLPALQTCRVSLITLTPFCSVFNWIAHFSNIVHGYLTHMQRYYPQHKTTWRCSMSSQIYSLAIGKISENGLYQVQRILMHKLLP